MMLCKLSQDGAKTLLFLVSHLKNDELNKERKSDGMRELVLDCSSLLVRE